MNPAIVEDALRSAALPFERVNDSTLQFLTEFEGTPFAQYFVDHSNALPESDDLYSFQYELLGDAYFQHPELQWSNYLYFVIDPEAFARLDPVRISEVEHDRNFARKLVLKPDEFRARLAERRTASSSRARGSNVEATWFELLSSKGIDRAIFTKPETSLKARLHAIEHPNAAKSPTAPAQLAASEIRHADVLSRSVRSLQTEAFRKATNGETFEFTDVTLIHGPNGAGKTSILEALEFFYCGTVRRDPAGKRPESKISVRFQAGKPLHTTGRTPPKTFRERNLYWYGIRDLKSSTLHDSFSIYNFLNVDAAAALETQADVDGSMKQALSILLVGASASLHWKEILRLHEAIPSQLRACQREVTLLRENLDRQRELARSRTAARKKSDAARAAAQASVVRLGLALEADADASTVAEIQGDVEAIEDLLELPLEARKLKPPITLNVLSEAAAELGHSISNADAAWERYESASNTLDELEDESATLDDQKRLTDRFAAYLSGGFVAALAERESVRNRLDSLQMLRQIEIPDLSPYEHVFSFRPHDALEVVQSTHSRNIRDYETAVAARDEARNTVTNLETLNATLVATATQLREHTHAEPSDEEPCPLCGADYSSLELTTRIAESASRSGATVLAGLEESAAVSQMRMVESASMVRFLEAICAPQDGVHWPSVEDAAAAITASSVLYDSEVPVLKEIDQRLAKFEQRGFDAFELDDLEADLRALLGAPIGADSAAMTENASKLLRKSESAIERRRISAEKKLGRAVEQVRVALDSKARTAEKLADVHEQLVERQSSITDFLGTMEEEVDLDLPVDVPIAEIKRYVRVAASRLAKLGAELRVEEQLQSVADGATTKLRTDLAAEVTKLENWSEARQVFDQIVSEHSLESATEAEMESNRDSIEWIFRRIQAPDDFVGLSEGSMTTLHRRDGTPARLNQVSTGQRSALALSVFLAMNFQLSNAPRVLLIDDPVAHVDDINAVAFLDYLREIAIAGDRQIVFATASTKLAGLFRRKFSFLGTERYSEIPLGIDD